MARLVLRRLRRFLGGRHPGSWIDHLYAQDMVNLGERGFVLARIGGSNGEPRRGVPGWAMVESHLDDRLHRRRLGNLEHAGGRGGPGTCRGQHRRALREQRHRELLGPPPTQSGADPPDLYDRWVQLGTFQPILRLHSNDEDRLPWEYPQPVQGITESFLRLREALVPYTYTLAAEANQTGLPMARPLYLDYPDRPAAYQNPTEYLYGPTCWWRR